MEYAKLIDGVLSFAPTNTKITSNYNLESNEAQLFADGYKRYIRSLPPQVSETERAMLSFEETETAITEMWSTELLSEHELEVLRKQAYMLESDTLFFKWQRGEATEQEWLDKVAEIKARY